MIVRELIMSGIKLEIKSPHQNIRHATLLHTQRVFNPLRRKICLHVTYTGYKQKNGGV